MAKLSVRDLDVAGKRVFCRVDFNVPIKDGKITDDTRIVSSLKTIKFLVEKGARVILASHLGRPKAGPDPKLSLKPIGVRLGELLGKPVTVAPDSVGAETEALAKGLKNGDVLLLENVRFHKEEDEKPNKETKQFTPERQAFAKSLAALAEVYVNDAFGTAHRDHCSTCGITQFLQPAAMGFLIEEELAAMQQVRENPARPLVVVLGGAKISDKIKIIDNFAGRCDHLLIGGGMAYTFLKAQGKEIGKSILDNFEESGPKAEKIMAKAKDGKFKLHLPVDCLAADKFDFKGDTDADAKVSVVPSDAIPADYEGLDIGPLTVAAYAKVIAEAKTIVWNGPVGVFEKDRYGAGTRSVAMAVALSGAYSTVGGGDSISAMVKFGLDGKFSHVSTGGGASLEYLAGMKLPGIDALNEKK